MFDFELRHFKFLTEMFECPQGTCCASLLRPKQFVHGFVRNLSGSCNSSSSVSRATAVTAKEMLQTKCYKRNVAYKCSTARRTRCQVTDEVMVVALSVGACPGGALAALKGLLERPLSKRVFTTKKGSDDPFSATSWRSPTVREGAESQQCLGMFGR